MNDVISAVNRACFPAQTAARAFSRISAIYSARIRECAGRSLVFSSMQRLPLNAGQLKKGGEGKLAGVTTH